MGFREKIIERARNARKESKYVEFKEKFDLNSPAEWCEIIKDIVAIANTGGGIILIGVKNNGDRSGIPYSGVLGLDPAKLTDKIAKYTGEQYCDFDILEIERKSSSAAAIILRAVPIPMVFIKPGTYSISDREQRNAFGQGTVYFRHGAKSEPGNSDDLRKVIERELENTRKSWLGDIRRVVNAPPDYKVHVLPPEIVFSEEPGGTPVRITDDKTAPAYRLSTPDETHPYRQKEVIEMFLKKNGKRFPINSYDVQCVRKVYGVNANKPEFCYDPKFGSPQYSEAFVNWLIDSFTQNPNFFKEARVAYKASVKKRR